MAKTATNVRMVTLKNGKAVARDDDGIIVQAVGGKLSHSARKLKGACVRCGKAPRKLFRGGIENWSYFGSVGAVTNLPTCGS